ncbi:MAG: 23S rRNA (adenine(2503)-C(2))-methyltransferase RlmN [Defluviitaleaceae bacterium]|nr:23S rRNA (adenine(2503)-C(2))-methyltransferase RlmN [Defluviitaleaceae bacterium]
MEKFDIRSASFDELQQFVGDMGEKPYRARQIFEWIHGKWAENIDEMTNLSAELRRKIGQIAEIPTAACVRVQKSTDGGTRKYLMQLHKNGIMDNAKVYAETVLMTYKHGQSLCVSTQAGCRMGCAFCATGIGGLQRNLTAGEIAAQYYAASRDVGGRIGNIVIMGSGEPLDNYDNVMRFIRLIGDERGAGVGQRRITLSTCGIVPRIYDLMEENLQITLAVSLNAPNDQIRRQLMPIARTYGIDELLEACRAYESALRRISFEYIMISGVNDSEGNAKELAKRLAGMKSHVNLIPANKVAEKGLSRSSDAVIKAFAGVLEKSGVEATVRRGLGSDISAACGQLRNEHNA